MALGCKGGRCLRLKIFMCRLSRKSSAGNRPVRGSLYLWACLQQACAGVAVPLGLPATGLCGDRCYLHISLSFGTAPKQRSAFLQFVTKEQMRRETRAKCDAGGQAVGHLAPMCTACLVFLDSHLETVQCILHTALCSAAVCNCIV